MRKLGAKNRVNGQPSTKSKLPGSRNATPANEKAACNIGYQGRIGDLMGTMPALDKATDTEAVLRIFPAMTPDDLGHIATYENREQLSAASCVYFQRKPHLAAELFQSNFGGSLDGWQPLCRDLDLAEKIPATAPFLTALDKARAAGSCWGTIQHTRYRNEALVRILAVVDADPDMKTYRAKRAQQHSGLNYEPDLHHWSQQGLWEKALYADIKRTQAIAREAMRKDYATRLHLGNEQASTLADFRLEQLIDVFIRDHSGGSSTLSYASLCLDTGDLDQYVADGKVPDKVCPDQEYVDASAPSVLRRLLGLAIINDYPHEVVQRLIDAKAELTAKSGEYEDPETPLMQAATRTDVIQALLTAGADPESQNGFGKTALMYAVAQNNLSGVRLLLVAGAKVDTTTYPLGKGCTDLLAGERTALMYAAWHAKPEVLKLLLDAKADRSLRDSKGETAQKYIARNDKLDAAQRAEMEKLLSN